MKSEIVTIRYSRRARRPGMAGSQMLLPGETASLKRWQAEAIRQRHPGLYEILGDAPAEMDLGDVAETDDLVAIKGIGEQTALKLAHAGYVTYASLAAADAQALAKAVNGRVADAERWQAQAEALMAAEEEAADAADVEEETVDEF